MFFPLIRPFRNVYIKVSLIFLCTAHKTNHRFSLYARMIQPKAFENMQKLKRPLGVINLWGFSEYEERAD